MIIRIEVLIKRYEDKAMTDPKYEIVLLTAMLTKALVTFSGPHNRCGVTETNISTQCHKQMEAHGGHVFQLIKKDKRHTSKCLQVSILA